MHARRVDVMHLQPAFQRIRSYIANKLGIIEITALLPLPRIGDFYPPPTLAMDLWFILLVGFCCGGLGFRGTAKKNNKLKYPLMRGVQYVFTSTREGGTRRYVIKKRGRPL